MVSGENNKLNEICFKPYYEYKMAVAESGLSEKEKKKVHRYLVLAQMEAILKEIKRKKLNNSQ